MLNTLLKGIGNWAMGRNLIEGSTVKLQMLKGGEEGGEVSLAVLDCDEAMFKDAVGDTVVVMTIQLLQEGEQPNEVLKVTTPQGLEAPSDFNFHNAKCDKTLLQLTVRHAALMGELMGAVARGKPIAPYCVAVCDNLCTLCYYVGVNFVDCVDEAYQEIKPRKGLTIDGVFIKEKDLSDEQRFIMEVNDPEVTEVVVPQGMSEDDAVSQVVGKRAFEVYKEPSRGNCNYELVIKLAPMDC
ncbi:MAG: hypothetical protein Unbinned4162contig1001_18 [Prokaryotic dsDNA virus sp.]|nr:MAG: hypothetical protein Unbinned4162contig1001_18 [Prokaryotic dsDNA virus sp.]|tara:strand:+ start:16305 stop:17024 length:720 start_codon:yes stop_codon:yes gene_type:complete